MRLFLLLFITSLHLNICGQDVLFTLEESYQTILLRLQTENNSLDSLQGSEGEIIKKIKSIYPNNKYLLSRIDTGYYFIYSYNKLDVFGILHNEEMLLPIEYKSPVRLFSNIYHKKNKCLILEINGKETVYKLRDKKFIAPQKYRRIYFNDELNLFYFDCDNHKITLVDINSEKTIYECEINDVRDYKDFLKLTKSDTTIIFNKNTIMKIIGDVIISEREKHILIHEKNNFELLDFNFNSIINGYCSEITLGVKCFLIKQIDGSIHIYNQKTNKYIKTEYDYISKDNINIVSINNKKGVIKIENEIIQILPCKYDNITFYDQFIVTKENNQFNLFKSDGTILSKKAVSNLKFCLYDSPNYWRTTLGLLIFENSIEVIDNNGKIILSGQYDDISPLFSKNNGNSCTEFIVTKNNKVGLIDGNGNLLLPIKYSYIENIDVNLIKVRKGDLFSIYSLSKNKFLTDFNYTEIVSNESCVGFTKTDSYELIINNDKVDNDKVEDCIAKKIDMPYFNTFSETKSKQNRNLYPLKYLGQYGLFNFVKGKFIILPKYEIFVELKTPDRYLVGMQGAYFIIDSNEEVVKNLGSFQREFNSIFSNDEFIYFRDSLNFTRCLELKTYESSYIYSEQFYSKTKKMNRIL